MSGNNLFDTASIPLSVIENNLRKLFVLPVRKDKKKPGRVAGIIWNSKFPLVEGIADPHISEIEITSLGARPGNHYHKGGEIYFFLLGTAHVHLKNVDTKQEETVFMGRGNKALYIKPNIAHVIVPCEDHVIIIAVADRSISEEGAVKYEIEHESLIDTA